MNKPIILIREEVKQELANVINNSNLPAYIIEPILVEFLDETRRAGKKQLEIAKLQYEKALQEEGKESSKDLK